MISKLILEAIKKINSSAECTVHNDDTSKIDWLNGTTPIPKADIEAKMVEVQADYDAKQYQRDRVYPSIGDQLDMQYKDLLNGTTTWKDAVAKVKSDNPKELYMSSIVKVDTIQENTSANGITVDGLNIKDSKLVTSNSVVTANITDANVTLAKLAGDSVDATKIADNAISEEHLDVTSITGHTAETSIADGDLVLIHDASASALRKMTKANFVSGIGGTNTPAFYSYMSGGQSIANETFVKIAFDTETFDVGGCYDTSNKRFVVPSGQAGKYVIMAKSAIDGIDDQEGISIALYKNGTRDDKTYMSDFSPYVNRLLYVEIVHVFDLSVGDYIEAFISHNEGEARSAENTYSFFQGYKLIE